MILLSKIAIDLRGFNEDHFGIFKEDDQPAIVKLWKDEAKEDVNKFIALLSPNQRDCVSKWAIDRSTYSVPELIHALEKFIKYLKSKSFSTYPPINLVKENHRRRSGGGGSSTGDVKKLFSK